MIFRRLRGWFTRNRMRLEIDQEIQFHLDMRRAEYRALGLTLREADRAARNRFGDISGTRRRVQRIRHVSHHLDEGMFQNMLLDFRYALRGLVRQPMFALFAILTIALGVGATTAIYSLVDSVILNPLPFEGSDRLAWVWRQREGGMMITPTTQELAVWRTAEQLEGMVNLHTRSFATDLGDGVEAISAAQVAPELFSFLGVKAVTGRPFVTADSVAGAPRVAILGERFWQSQYGSSRDVLGQDLELDGERYEIVGVAPASLDALFRIRDSKVWIPLIQADSIRGMTTLVRVRESATFASAQAELDVFHAEAAEQSADGWKPKLVRPHMMVSSQLRSGLWVLLVSVGLVLLIACANVANMLLAKGVGRRHEMGIRAAMGAGRARLMRQLLVESLTLSALGSGVGIGLALAIVRLVKLVVPRNLIELSYTRLSPAVLGVGILAGLAAGLLFSLAPLVQNAGDNSAASLRHGNRVGDSTGRSYLRQGLVGLEVALAFVLFASAGLFIRSFANLTHVDPGFDADRLVSVRLELPGARYASAASREAFVQDVLERVRQLPPVAQATVAMGVPPRLGVFLGPVEVEGREGALDAEAGVISANLVQPDYFETLGVRFVEGRSFKDGDPDSYSVINQRFGQEMWPGMSPLDRRFRWVGQEEWQTVIGVVEDVKALGLDDDPNRAQVYQIYDPAAFGGGVVLARAAGDPEDIVNLVRGQVSSVDPSLPILEATTIAHMYTDSIARPRFNTVLLASFAALAMVLALTGVYGVIALTMNQRLKEIGVRMALGARAVDVKLLALRWGLKPVIIGTGVGVVIAAGTSRFLRSMLFDVSAVDPLTYAGVAITMILVGAAATLLPARRAARVDPVATLRLE